MIIQPDWKLVQCTQCLKINRIPGSGIFDDEIKGTITFKDQVGDNEFDIKFPVAYSIVNCPFCKNDNRISKKATKISCYSCRNIFTVNQDPYNDSIDYGNYKKKERRTEQRYSPLVNEQNNLSKSSDYKREQTRWMPD